MASCKQSYWKGQDEFTVHKHTQKKEQLHFRPHNGSYYFSADCTEPLLHLEVHHISGMQKYSFSGYFKPG